MCDFNLDLNNAIIYQQYLKNNYFIEGDLVSAHTVYIYFSSNALYYPNTFETFEHKIIKNNRYEWTKRSVKGVGIASIYVRDLFKQWCVVGINQHLDSLDKVADFLKSLVKDKKVITVGSSAGGYLATIFGILLNAHAVFNFSGQFELSEEIVNDYSLLSQYKNDPQRNKYFSITSFIKKSYTPIFYFYPAYNNADLLQKKLVENFDNVYCFGFNTANHGVPIYPSNLTKLLCISHDKLIDICKKYCGSTINQFAFSVKIGGLFKSVYSLSRDKVRSVYLSIKRKLR